MIYSAALSGILWVMKRATKLKILVPIIYALLGSGFCAYLLVMTSPNFWQYGGTIIAISSFAFWIAARVQLADNFSIGAQANQLVTTGLYANLSHPVYYFSITALGGIALVSQHWLVGLVWAALVILEIVRIRAEERVLEAKFGSTYRAYKQKVWL